MAAKTLVTAVDAAAAPNPAASRRPAEARTERPVAAPSSAAPRVSKPQVAQTVRQVRQTSAGIAEGGRQFGRAVWKPFVRLSGVLWLELTGVFFGLFALTAGVGAWKLRGAAHGAASGNDTRSHFVVALIVAVVFGYFCVSSFVRARRRGQAR